MDAHVRKRHVLIIRGVGGSRIDVLVMPGRCDARSRRRSMSVFQSWTCAAVVVVLSWRGVWYVVGVPCWSPLGCILFWLYPSTRGYIRGTPEYRSGPRYYLDGSLR